MVHAAGAALHAVSLAVFAASSLLAGFNPAPVAVSAAFLAAGYFFRGWQLPAAALASFAGAVAVSRPAFGLGSAVFFTVFCVFPFFACFRKALAKSDDFLPVEAVGALAPALVVAALAYVGAGAFFSSAESFSALGIATASVFALLAIALAAPLAGWAHSRLKPPG